MLPPAGRPPRKSDDRPPVQPRMGPAEVGAVPARRPRTKPMASQGALLPAARQLTPAELAAFATIETEMGGRAKLVATLSTAQLPAKLFQVLGMIADPRHDAETLGHICAQGGVGLGELMTVFQSAALTRGKMLAITRIAAASPDVAAAVMDEATPGVKTCPRCLGAMKLPKPTTEDPSALTDCPDCSGLGTIYHHPEHEVQKTALKIAGLLDTGKGGVNIAVLQNQMTHNRGDIGEFDTFMEGLDALLYGTGRDRVTRQSEVVDGEVTDGE